MALGIEHIIFTLENLPEKISPKLATKLQPVMDDITQYAINCFYTDWSSTAKDHYVRTYNFMNNWQTTVSPVSGGIKINVSEDLMMPYFGWDGKHLFDSKSAFSAFFDNGEHGHGKWLMETTKPPAEYFDEQVDKACETIIPQLAIDAIEEVFSEEL